MKRNIGRVLFMVGPYVARFDWRPMSVIRMNRCSTSPSKGSSPAPAKDHGMSDMTRPTPWVCGVALEPTARSRTAYRQGLNNGSLDPVLQWSPESGFRPLKTESRLSLCCCFVLFFQEGLNSLKLPTSFEIKTYHHWPRQWGTCKHLQRHHTDNPSPLKYLIPGRISSSSHNLVQIVQHW